ncbi:MAG: hypothetical protein ACJA2S_001257 [Cyclobacteriaceae bacterium]|jgi:hypothetical protein
MESEKFLKRIGRAYRAIWIIMILAAILPFVAYFFVFREKEELEVYAKVRPVEMTNVADEVKDGIHVPSGFIANEGFKIVLANCTNCHSAKLVIQNRATREGWESMIRWMQHTQKLWDLGENEDIILDYLSKNYAPEEKGRRATLSNVEWYVLED